MASYLAQFQSIKSACSRLIIAVEDVSDLWPLVKDAFEERTPFKKTTLNNKTHIPIHVENLPAEFILTTDARLRSRFPQEQSVFWFREPYATVVLVTCEDLDEFRTILKPRLKLIVQNDEKEWIIVFVSKAHPSNDQASKMAKKIYAKLEVDFNIKKKERCCKFDLHGTEANIWEDLETKILESIRNTLDRRIQFYEEEIRKLSELRFMPTWNFCNFFILKESLAFMFEMAHLHEDALREYDELELCYLETVNSSTIKRREFGGCQQGDDQAALLNPDSKPLTQIVQEDSFREFEFRQYLFACQCKLLIKLSRLVEIAVRGHSFMVSFSRTLTLHENALPFCLKEVWTISASMALIDLINSKYDATLVTPDVDKECGRLVGYLYSLARVKLMRVAYLIGNGVDIERTPVNSAALSMLPWPKPAYWPSVSLGTSPESLFAVETNVEAKTNAKFMGIERKLLPLEPSSLLREANRRRISRSVGNASELHEGFSERNDGLDHGRLPVGPISRAYSSPLNFESPMPLDQPMKLCDIHAAAREALRRTISDATLLKTLSSVEQFEAKFIELTKGAAENYHRSWWKRHGVVLDGEIAAISFKHGNIDLAAKSYEKVCALYSGEGWHDLLAQVLPNLAECQKLLDDQAGYLLSCIRLLSLGEGLFLNNERRGFQAEVLRLARSETREPLPLDVSSLITFSGDPGPPLQLCDGDPGVLSVTLWSGFPDHITLESLSLTLIPTFSTDEQVKPIKLSSSTDLKPGMNLIKLELPPQRPGSYALGVLTGHIGTLLFRSHSFSRSGPPDSEDFMNYEKPTRPVLKVFEPRALVDISAAVSSALLMNETQRVGLVTKPLDYPLKGAVLQIEAGPGLVIDEMELVEVESTDNVESPFASSLRIHGGRVTLPDWASNVTSTIWLPVRAVCEELARGTSTGSTSQKQNIVDGMRTIALRLEFGVAHNQIFERTIAVHFTHPFHICSRVANKYNGDGLLLQVEIHSLVNASLRVDEAWLEVQGEVLVVGKGDGKPISTSFPLVLTPSSSAGVLFSIHFGESDALQVEGVLTLEYGINGDKRRGAHEPIGASQEKLLFKSVLTVQRPVLNPCLSVGFFSLPSSSLRMGQLICIKWRLSRLKKPDDAPAQTEILYEVDANPENWMIAGRKCGHVSLSGVQGSTAVVMVNCLALVAGHVHPPQLALPGVQAATVSYDPPGPHLVCVLPPVLSSSYCVPLP
ncbi:TRAPP II complex TRAPPC10/CLUB [Wolffia australiana]